MMWGWMCFGTLLLLVLAFLSEMQSGFGRAFGYGSSRTPWGFIFGLVGLAWLLFLLTFFGAIHWWFQ